MNLLVSAGNKYINSVMEELTQHFQPGLLPHYFVIQSMGKLASANRKSLRVSCHWVLVTELTAPDPFLTNRCYY